MLLAFLTFCSIFNALSITTCGAPVHVWAEADGLEELKDLLLSVWNGLLQDQSIRLSSASTTACELMLRLVTDLLLSPRALYVIARCRSFKWYNSVSMWFIYTNVSDNIAERMLNLHI